MDMTTKSCREFVAVLASNEPAPGGGGAAALVGAIGTALGNMVGSLTVGKKKYADVEAELVALLAWTDEKVLRRVYRIISERKCAGAQHGFFEIFYEPERNAQRQLRNFRYTVRRKRLWRKARGRFAQVWRQLIVAPAKNFSARERDGL